ncbi:YdcF family protein [Candidatus Kaiserbacteria bacterium]|nr:YdcF family protein [Candidatus Kaiserbacteria bacterium]
MTKNEAINKIWDYMHINHNLKKADVIFVLGNRDIRVAEYATKLYFNGLAPIILFSGSGNIHNSKPGREQFIGSTEAEVFANIARKLGVPDEAILVENKSQNTGENYKFALNLLAQRGVGPKTIIAVQKPYMERRTYATGKVHLSDDIELIVTSPPIPVAEYSNEPNSKDEHWLNAMVGDLQRIKEYPAKGFQIEQEIPYDVWQAYEFLVEQGYNKRLIKD